MESCPNRLNFPPQKFSSLANNELRLPPLLSLSLSLYQQSCIMHASLDAKCGNVLYIIQTMMPGVTWATDTSKKSSSSNRVRPMD